MFLIAIGKDLDDTREAPERLLKDARRRPCQHPLLALFFSHCLLLALFLSLSLSHSEPFSALRAPSRCVHTVMDLKLNDLVYTLNPTTKTLNSNPYTLNPEP